MVPKEVSRLGRSLASLRAYGKREPAAAAAVSATVSATFAIFPVSECAEDFDALAGESIRVHARELWTVVRLLWPESPRVLVPVTRRRH